MHSDFGTKALSVHNGRTGPSSESPLLPPPPSAFLPGCNPGVQGPCLQMELTAHYIIRPAKFIGREVESYFRPANWAVGIQPEQVSSCSAPAARLPPAVAGASEDGMSEGACC